MKLFGTSKPILLSMMESCSTENNDVIQPFVTTTETTHGNAGVELKKNAVALGVRWNICSKCFTLL